MTSRASFGPCDVSDATLKFAELVTAVMTVLHILSALFIIRFLPLAWCAALTTAVSANERLCFYADVDKAGEKIGVSKFDVNFLDSQLKFCLVLLFIARFFLVP